MSEFPATHTTATGGPSAPQTSARPHLDLSYVTSIAGILKIAQVVVGFITFCICASLYGSHAGWSAFVAFTGFFGALVLLIIFAFHINDLVPRLAWGLIELVFYGIYTFFFFIAFIVMCVLASHSYYRATPGAGAFFSLICLVLFAVETFFKIRSWRESAGAAPPPPTHPNTGAYP